MRILINKKFFNTEEKLSYILININKLLMQVYEELETTTIVSIEISAKDYNFLVNNVFDKNRTVFCSKEIFVGSYGFHIEYDKTFDSLLINDIPIVKESLLTKICKVLSIF